MSEINTSIILDGISLALRTAYPNSQIESDSIEQGLKPPAFIILLIDGSQSQRVGKRWRRQPRFDILYFPTSKRGREECYKVADNLSQVLEVIKLPGGDSIRGTDISFNVVDNVLHFNISYKYYAVTESDSEDAIESLENTEIKL